MLEHVSEVILLAANLAVPAPHGVETIPTPTAETMRDAALAVHVVVQHFSVVTAWIITLSEAYGVLWLLGDYNALRSRPTLVVGGALQIRHGLRWNLIVELTNIAAVEHLDPLRPETGRRRRSLRLAILQPPTRRIILRQPQTAHALYGIHRTVESIDLAPDDLERFDRLVKD